MLLCAGALALSAAAALAQGSAVPDEKDPGFFTSIGRWFDQQVSGAKDAFNNLGREAGIAAKTTAETARDAADSLAKKIPSATAVVSGHEVCRIAPNGAPDCDTAATNICKAKGFKSGKSMDMTTAENCPARVYIAGRSAASECRTETFVSSALCQ